VSDTGSRSKKHLQRSRQDQVPTADNIKMYAIRDCAILNAWVDHVRTSDGQKIFYLYLCDNLLESLDKNELAAILAHEIAHVEFFEKNGSRMLGVHWLVDERAAQLTSPEGVVSMLRKSKKAGMNSRAV